MSKHNHKPFEQHIESNEFNVNPLVDEGTNVSHQVLHPRLEAWMDTLPHPIHNGRWDDELDDMQRRLRYSLAYEILRRGMLDEFATQLEGVDDDTLLLMIQYPITLTMLSQDYFRQNGYPYGWEVPDKTLEDKSTKPELPQTPLKRIQCWVAKQVQRLIKWVQKS